MQGGGYSFGEDRRLETERLAAVEHAFDGPTRAALSEAGVQSGWRCWEVGAGRGSIANWLGEVVTIARRVLLDEPYAEMARDLRCSEQVVRQRVSRGLSTLRANLGERTMSDPVDVLRSELVRAAARAELSAPQRRWHWCLGE